MSNSYISGKGNLPILTVHMVVKNEDQWVWYSLQSVLPFAARILITDTGSTDHTVPCIRSIASPKIELSVVQAATSSQVTAARQAQIEQTKTDWIWVVDGDEIYPETTAQEILRAVSQAQYEGIVVKRFDLLGDIYHRQREGVGMYHLFGQKGHLVTRLVNQHKIDGLHYRGNYPMEGWYDSQGISTQQRSPEKWYITDNALYHAMYLRRSSLGSNLPMFNRSKYKVEKGLSVPGPIPAVFSLPRPSFVPDALTRRSASYELAAAILTPIKELKRKIL